MFWAKLLTDFPEFIEAQEKDISIPFCLYKREFKGVIVRNIPRFTRPEEIVSLFSQALLHPVVQSVEVFRSEIFCLVQLPTIQECEKAAWVFSRHQIKQNHFIKTRIHPQSNFKRMGSTRCKPFKELWTEPCSPVDLAVKEFREDILNMQKRLEITRAEQEKQRQIEFFTRARFEYSYRYGLDQSPHKTASLFGIYGTDWNNNLNVTPEKERTAGYGYSINTSNQVRMMSRENSEDNLTRPGIPGRGYPQPS